MTTHAQGERGPRHEPGTYILVTHDQLAIPMGCRAASPDGHRLSPIQKWVLQGLQRLCRKGKGKSLHKDHEIAEAIGLTGTKRSVRSQIQIALHGRTARKWNPETGKRDGEPVRVPGLCDPALGFVEVNHLPTGERELTLTAKWSEWSRFHVFRGDDGGARESSAGSDKRAIPEAVHAVVIPPPHSPPPGAVTEPGPTIAAPIVDAPPAPAGQPSPEVLAEVLGNHAGAHRPGQAWQLAERMRRRGVRFDLGDDDSLQYEVGKGYDPLNGSEKSVIRWLKPEVVELLKAEAEKSSPRAKCVETNGGEKFAPRVAKPAEIRAMIAELTARPADDDSDCRALARRLVEEFRDSDRATSEGTYSGIASDTKRGAIPEAVMIGAFEAACRPKVCNRGAAFVAEVKRIKAGLMAKDHEGGPAS